MEPPQTPLNEAGSDAAAPGGSRVTRVFFFFLGVTLTVVGIAGYFLPLLPGTIFLILAAACFARSSRRFETWLVQHPRFGTSVRAWRASGAIPFKAKVLAITMMAISMAMLLLFSHAPLFVLVLSVLFLGGSALFVVTRPGVK